MTGITKGKSILIVDDDVPLSTLYQHILEPDGFTVRLAHGGEEALTLLNGIPVPDLILVDCLMPVMSGE